MASWNPNFFILLSLFAFEKTSQFHGTALVRYDIITGLFSVLLLCIRIQFSDLVSNVNGCCYNVFVMPLVGPFLWKKIK